MSCMEGELDAALDPLARATLDAWEWPGVRPVILQRSLYDVSHRHAMPTTARLFTIAPARATNVIPFRRHARG